MFRPTAFSEIPPRPEAKEPTLIAFAGASGGQGVTTVVAQVGVYIASLGRRVVVVDMASTGPALAVALGAELPHAPSTKLLTTKQPSLGILWPGWDQPRFAGGPVRKTFLASLRELEVDYVLQDFGTLHTLATQRAYLSIPFQVSVLTPEPGALAAYYRMLRRLFLVHLSNELSRDEYVRARARARRLGGAPSPLDLWRDLENDGEVLAEAVLTAMDSFVPMFVVNQTRLRADLDLGDQVRVAVKRRLGVQLDYLGQIELDENVSAAPRLRKTVLSDMPATRAAKAIERLARRLLAHEAGRRKKVARVVPRESHHDMLEVHRLATDEDIRRAYRKSREIYSNEGYVTYGLLSEPEREAIRTRLDEAYEVLLDPERRRPYEHSVFPGAENSAQKTEGALSSAILPKAPVLEANTVYDGAILRAVRESKGLSLEEIARSTRIALHHLQAIEKDAYGDLPAPVYVRGFVVLLSRVLKLDPDLVSRGYVRRLRQYLETQNAP